MRAQQCKPRMGLHLKGSFLLRKSVAWCPQCVGEGGRCHLYILFRCTTYQGSAGEVHGVFLSVQQAGRIRWLAWLPRYLIHSASPSIRHFSSSYGNLQPMAHPVFDNAQAMHHLPASASISRGVC